nr:MAG TPA: hypothetical protein [Caudoviricetes sp.]
MICVQARTGRARRSAPLRKTAHYMEFVPRLPCKRLNLHCVET